MELGKCEKTQAANVCEFEYLHVECPSHSLPPVSNNKENVWDVWDGQSDCNTISFFSSETVVILRGA